MTSFLHSILLIVTAVTAIKCDLFKCPDPEVMQNFTVSEVLGKWYVVQETKKLFSRVCPLIIVKEGEKENTLSILSKEKNLIWGKADFTRINASLDPSQKARMRVTYEGPLKVLTKTEEYSVIDGDHKTYAVVWGCNRFLAMAEQKVFILGRERTLSDEIVHHVLDLLHSLNLSQKELSTTVQDDCSDM